MTDLMLLSHCRWVVICKISEGIPWHYCKNITVKQRQSPHTSTHAYKENQTTHTYTKAQEESYRQVFKVYSHFHQAAKWKPWGNIQQIVRLIWGFFWKGWMVLLIQEMFRNTWLGDSEGPFPSGRTCYEFLIVLFRHTSLGEAWSDRLSSRKLWSTCSWYPICKSMNSTFYAP